MPISPLALLDALSPSPRPTRRLARALPYGDGPRRRLDVYAPARKADAALPLAVFFYGGSWSEGERGEYGFAARLLASLGCVAVVPDYRVLPEVEYPRFLFDCADAVRFALSHAGAWGADAGRLVLAGHSAGAYNAAMLALDPRFAELPVKAMVGLSGPYDFHPFRSPITLRTFGAVPDQLATQPVNHVTAAAPPMFLATGGRDGLVLPRNTTALSRLLREAGVAVTERTYPRLGHAGTLLEFGSLLGFRTTLRHDVAEFLAREVGAPPL